MTSEFWLGTLWAIPSGIIASLLTPLIVKAYNNSNENRRIKTIEKVKSEYLIIKKYKENPQELSLYLINIVIKTTLMSAIVSVLSGIFTLIAQLLIYSSLLFGLSQIIVLFGSMFIINICRPAFSIWSKIKNYDEYIQRLKDANVIEKDLKFY